MYCREFFFVPLFLCGEAKASRFHHGGTKAQRREIDGGHGLPMENSEEPYFSCGSQMLAVPVSLGPHSIQPTNSLAIWPGRKSLEEVREITFEIGMLGAVWAGHQRPQGDPCPAGAAGKDLLGAAAGVHQVRRLQEDRAGMNIGVELGEEWEMAVAEIRMIMVAFRQSFDTSTLARNYIQSERASHSD